MSKNMSAFHDMAEAQEFWFNPPESCQIHRHTLRVFAATLQEQDLKPMSDSYEHVAQCARCASLLTLLIDLTWFEKGADGHWHPKQLFLASIMVEEERELRVVSSDSPHEEPLPDGAIDPMHPCTHHLYDAVRSHATGQEDAISPPGSPNQCKACTDYLWSFETLGDDGNTARADLDRLAPEHALFCAPA